MSFKQHWQANTVNLNEIINRKIIKIIQERIGYIKSKKSLKIPKGQSESVYRRRTDNTMGGKKYKRTNNDLQNIHIKLISIQKCTLVRTHIMYCELWSCLKSYHDEYMIRLKIAHLTQGNNIKKTDFFIS
jgi:hypothetical protein